ncbi:MAG: hypothetical protein OSB41_09190 [Kiritimatiellae bacterium]|nr:hypothetical protein [Kiritimatiellia bacterium]
MTNLPAADFSAANLGQLKNMARGAYVHMLARHGVSSFAISNMVHSFSPTNNFHVVTLGQAKHVAAPFYDWLIARGHRQSYPWSGASLTNDFAALNSGQLKSLFSLRSSNYAQTSQATPRQVEPIFGVKNRLYR